MPSMWLVGKGRSLKHVLHYVRYDLVYPVTWCKISYLGSLSGAGATTAQDGQ